MTDHIKIQGITPRIQYVANGVLTSYTFPFAIFHTEDVDVYLNDTLQATNTYQVNFDPTTAGGTIVFNSAPAENIVITIMRNLSIERTTDFQEGGALRANTLNDELDYQTACQQQIADSLNRSMVLPPYAVNTNVDLTLPLPSAGKAIVWNSDGTNLENSTVAVNDLESTLNGYKTTAETAASTATEKATIASYKADIATAKAAEAVSTLASKATTDMDNLSETGKATAASLALPSNESVDQTLSPSASNYVAPAAGWYIIRKKATGVGEYLRIFNSYTGLGYQLTAATANSTIDCAIPVQKNDTINIIYSLGGSTERFKFVYAKGAIS